MKKYSLLSVAALSALLLFVGCGKDDSSGLDSRLVCAVGEAWIYDGYPAGDREGYVGRADGSFIVVNDYSGGNWSIDTFIGSGTWSTKGDRLTLIFAKWGSATLTYKVSGNTVTADWDGTIYTLTKITGVNLVQASPPEFMEMERAGEGPKLFRSR